MSITAILSPCYLFVFPRIIIYKSKTTIFSLQSITIINSLFGKLTKVSTNNSKAGIKGISGRLKMCFNWLIELCFTPLLTVFQSYHSASSHDSRLSWVSPVLGWALRCLAQGYSHEKTQRTQCGSNPGPPDYESNTLPLSHVGPVKNVQKYSNCINPSLSSVKKFYAMLHKKYYQSTTLSNILAFLQTKDFLDIFKN